MVEFYCSIYGDFFYDDFGVVFNDLLVEWDLDEWVCVFKCLGVWYVVFVIKYYDGFLFWLSVIFNFYKLNWGIIWDVVGEFVEVVCV